MADFIDREALMKFPIRRDHCDKEHANEHFINGIETVMEYAENLPTADVEPVRHGRWEMRPTGMETDTGPEYKAYCTVCNEPNKQYQPPYWPHCGAKMQGTGEEKEVE